MITKLGRYLVMPGQYRSWKHKKALDRYRKKLSQNYNSKEIAITGEDNVQLNAMFFKKPTSFFSCLRSKKILIRFGGNGEIYETHAAGNIKESYISIGHKLGYDVLLFNYRGFGKSKDSPTPDRLTQDGQAVIDYALKQGYKPENVVIHGFSIGGAIATKTLASKEHVYKEIKFINDRSFSSLEKVIKNFRIAPIFKRVLLLMLKICRWNIDVTKDWKKLKNPKIILFSDTDKVVSGTVAI